MPLVEGRKLRKITALGGGVGASRLLLGLYEVSAPARLTIIVNTGDDIELHGLKISPDLDIVTYTLAGIVDPAKGWGIRGETFHALKRSEEHTSELQSRFDLVCRLLLEKKK